MKVKIEFEFSHSETDSVVRALANVATERLEDLIEILNRQQARPMRAGTRETITHWAVKGTKPSDDLGSTFDGEGYLVEEVDEEPRISFLQLEATLFLSWDAADEAARVAATSGLFKGWKFEAVRVN
jgi:hypothetical protein